MLCHYTSKLGAVTDVERDTHRYALRTRFLILDEADRLLGSDFLPQVEPIVKACTHPLLQKCCLSATMEAGPEALAKSWLRDEGVRIVVGLK